MKHFINIHFKLKEIEINNQKIKKVYVTIKY